MIKVVTFCGYPGAGFPEGGCTAEVEAAKLLVLAAKGARRLHWTRVIPAMGGAKRWTIDQETREKVFEWFAGAAGGEVSAKTGRILVPVPGSRCTSARLVREGAAFKLAEALGKGRGIGVVPLLYWDRPMRRASEGGEREAGELLGRLRCRPPPEEAREAVLVDDVVTLGGHIRACEAALRGYAGVEVRKAVCLARTIERPTTAVFGKRTMMLPRLKTRGPGR